jgi:hypothetical protein
MTGYRRNFIAGCGLFFERPWAVQQGDGFREGSTHPTGCFAEESFGRQFVIFDGKIGIFEVETGDLNIVALSLEEWASKILLDYNQMTGYGLAHEWQRNHGRLHPRHRLMAKKPFVLGGEYSLANLVSLDSLLIMKSLGNLAHQIHVLPDGAKIELKVL